MYFINLLHVHWQQDIPVIYSTTNRTQKKPKRITGSYLSWQRWVETLINRNKPRFVRLGPILFILWHFGEWTDALCVSECPLPRILPAHTRCKGLCRSNACRHAPFSSWTQHLRSPLTDSAADISPQLSKKHNTESGWVERSCVVFRFDAILFVLVGMHA